MSERYSAFDLLEGDHSGTGLHTLQDLLLNMKSTIRTAMDAGLSSEDFSLAQKSLLAVETAEEIIPTLHEKMLG
ncbi:MAG: hypothetical protein IJU37_03990 [Desulfovibrio sp.]|nr:hypothetical protein [Desulfovibrio sp.]